MLQANINKETLIFKIIKYFSFGITGVRLNLPQTLSLNLIISLAPKLDIAKL